MATITVNNNGILKKISYSQGESLLAILQKSNVVIEAPCGGKGICGRCTVVINGQKEQACRFYPEGDIEVDISTVSKSILTDSADINSCGTGYGLAVDIGTTTVAVYLYDLETGRCLKQTGEKNRQCAYGADVISRINAAEKVGVKKLQDIIRTQITDMASVLTDDLKKIVRVSIAGNTVMEHLFAGLSPESIGRAPFSPLSLFGNVVETETFAEAFADGCTVYMAPAISGYVGGDITAGAYYTGIGQENQTVLFIDIGTNGEMMLGNKDGFISCATAAGPVFDSGALWGSNLIDVVARLLDEGIIDSTGRLEKDYQISEGVVLKAETVRSVQLGKAAIRAGIETLLAKSEKTCDDVDKVYVAGGFGNYIDADSACTIGMIPMQLKDKIVKVGNTAGKGAAELLTDKARTEIRKLTEKISYEELSSSQLFNEFFIDNISFE